MTKQRFNTTKDVRRICKTCGDPFMARSADVKRGWAKFCSKSCKAIKQTQRTGYAGPSLDFDRTKGTHERRGSFLGSEIDIRPGDKA